MKTLAATSSGLVTFSKANLTAGSKVKKGQMLLTINSSNLSTNNLSAEITKAKADFEQAKAEYERKKKLYDSKVVPKSEFEQVKKRYQVARSNYYTLSTGYSNGGKQIIAPFDGYVKSVAVANGDFTEQGAPLLKIASQQSSLLEVSVSPDYAMALSQIKDIKYQVSESAWSNLNKHKGKVLSVSKTVSPSQPLLTVYAQVNEAVEMPEGSFTKAHVMVGDAQKAIIIPTQALLEEYGNYSVIVQLSGESFERRQITIGKENGDEVEVISGLAEGEIIVTTGAYQVNMASMSGQAPAHGHAH
jgi:RND family efflux transporter MFP subunit